MNIFTRIKNIFSVETESAVKKLEDPEKMLDQNLKEANLKIADFREKIAETMANRSMMEKTLSIAEKRLSEYHSYAEKAVREENDDDARLFLSKEMAEKENVDTLRNSVATLSSDIEDLKKMNGDMSLRVSEMSNKRDVLKSKISISRIKENMNGILNYDSSSICANFDETESTIDKMFYKAVAIDELNNTSEESVLKSTMKKYDDAEKNVEIEKMLLSLKGISAAQA